MLWQRLGPDVGFLRRGVRREVEPFVQAAGSVALQVEGDVAKPDLVERLDDGRGASKPKKRANLPTISAEHPGEQSAGRPVLDETGLKGVYDFSLQWTPGNEESLLAAVRNQIGLELTPAKRPAEMLVVEKP